jgi:hypothetical protein
MLVTLYLDRRLNFPNGIVGWIKLHKFWQGSSSYIIHCKFFGY